MADGDLGTLYYTVEANTAQLVSGNRDVDNSLNRVNRRFGQTDQAAKKTQFEMNKTAQAVQRVNAESQAASLSLGNMGRILGGLVSARAIVGLLQTGESYRAMGERIRGATSDLAEYEMVQARLLQTANNTYRSLSEAQEVYIQTSIGLRNMGYSTEQALDIVDSLSYSFVRNETSADKAASALNALTRATNRGTVLTDHWASLLIAVPTILEDIVSASGMTAEEIIRLGYSGQLSADLLTEGLRRSLAVNKQASDAMATTIQDAMQRMRNSISAYIGESESAAESSALIASTISTLGENIETVANILLTVGAAALARYVTGIGLAVAAKGALIIETRRAAAEELRLAKAQSVAANAAVANARLNATLGGSHTAVTAAVNAQTAATARLAAAQAAAARGGAALVATLGGPAGIAALVAASAAAMYLFRDSSDAAQVSVEGLTEAVDKLGTAQINLQLEQLPQQLSELEKQATALMNSIGRREMGGAVRNWLPFGDKKTIAEERAELERLQETISELRARMVELQDERNRRAFGGSDSGSGAGSDPDPQAEQRLQSMRNEIELLKVSGEERLKLQAIQRLGAKATGDQKKEAADLAVRLERLQEAEKALAEEETKLLQQRQSNIETVTELRQQLELAALAGEELAVAQALLRLNPAATPEEVAEVERLASELWQAGEQAKRLALYSDDALAAIRGDVTPLTGGAFDNQYARYAAEERAEKERYDKQLARLREARELQIDTIEDYNALEQQLMQEHAARLAQIEQAKNQVLMASGEELFDSLAGAARGYLGEASSAYKALFAISKTFAISNAVLNLSSAVSQALADPTALTPAQKFANMAAVSSAGANLVNQISGATFGGGRQHGGPVDSGKFYRINETGAPEILNTNGKQYLMMNQSSGSVTPMTGKGGAGIGGSMVVNVNIASDGSVDTESPAGLEQFGREIGTFVEAKFNELTVRNQRQGGMLWNGGGR